MSERSKVSGLRGALMIIEDEVKTPSPIIQRILDALKGKGFEDDAEKRKELKRITGISKQNLTHWYNGTTQWPSVEAVIQIAREHDLDPIWLLMGESMQDYWAKANPNDTFNGGATLTRTNVANIENATFYGAT